MLKLSLQILAAMLGRHTSLCARTANATCWSSRYVMMNSYVDFLVVILQVNVPELSKLLLSEVEDEVVDALFKKLYEHDSATRHYRMRLSL